ncbi:hypothetical protein HRbin32_01302 [bacterium HR32]|nr:hypothetical protein HRbin32_01302 [bacterium HR32]
MPAVKPLDRVARKWIERASVAGPEYEAGVRAPRVPWDQAAVAAADIWREAVTRAAAEDRYERGVQSAGLARWQQRAVAKGPARFGEGVRLAEADYRSRWGAVRQGIEGVTLPPPGPKGSPQNVQRFVAMRDALIRIGRELRGQRGS